MDYNTAKQIMNENFIGYEELLAISEKLNISISKDWIDSKSKIPFEEKYLRSVSKSHLLILFIPYNKNNEFITLIKLRNFFGLDPEIKQPCFYNQDWYINEPFAKFCFKQEQWFCIRKEVLTESRGKVVKEDKNLPHALICAYTFFAAYFITNKYLWKNDYIWCKDLDSNGDRIYVGRYLDPNAKAKNGFSIHRHLSISRIYGSIC